ncbi:hypothetical protein N7467_011935, partial [Penicillium canescens]
TRTIHLISFRNSLSQRGHFTIFVLSAADPNRGTLIYTIGAPIAGYILEFKRNYSPTITQQHHKTFLISQVPTPGISQNFIAPINDIRPLTIDFVRYLVSKGLIAAEAIQIIQSKRDPLSHRIGL